MGRVLAQHLGRPVLYFQYLINQVWQCILLSPALGLMEAGRGCYSHSHPVLYCMYEVSLGCMGTCLEQNTKANLGEFYNLDFQVIETLLRRCLKTWHWNNQDRAGIPVAHCVIQNIKQSLGLKLSSTCANSRNHMSSMEAPQKDLKSCSHNPPSFFGPQGCQQGQAVFQSLLSHICSLHWGHHICISVGK